jgi:hypothetical protein
MGQILGVMLHMLGLPSSRLLVSFWWALSLMQPHTKLLGDCKSGERGDYRSFEIIQNPNNEDNSRTFGRAVTSRATLFEPCFCNYMLKVFLKKMGPSNVCRNTVHHI